ncbi:chemokine binding protein [Skunkpox virus]|uniref:Chemokine binding protein n=1 Tax=Skunkpox virus TaxID=160796 RepID=A0A1C9KBY9_9POXV|nr:chemokine binding protein [Skunkpox virus]AOP31640.1 chemokine binding protein [Skunkpox virus]
MTPLSFIILLSALLTQSRSETIDDNLSICNSDKEYMGIEVYVEATLYEPARETICESEIHEYGASISNSGLNISVDLLNCFLNFHMVGVHTTRYTVYAKFSSLDPWTMEPINVVTRDKLVKLTEECIADIYLKCEIDRRMSLKYTGDRLTPKDFKSVPPSNVGSMIELQSDYCIEDATVYVKIYDECGKIKQRSIPTMRDYFTTKSGQPRKILKNNKFEMC